MNLSEPRIQKAIIDIAESSESHEVAEVCRVVIDDHLDHDETEIDSPREVILIALEAIQRADEATESNSG